MYCLGTNILRSFIFLMKSKHIILFSNFYLFQNVPIDLLFPKGSHCFAKKYAVLEAVPQRCSV